MKKTFTILGQCALALSLIFYFEPANAQNASVMGLYPNPAKPGKDLTIISTGKIASITAGRFDGDPASTTSLQTWIETGEKVLSPADLNSTTSLQTWIETGEKVFSPAVLNSTTSLQTWIETGSISLTLENIAEQVKAGNLSISTVKFRDDMQNGTYILTVKNTDGTQGYAWLVVDLNQ